MTLVKTRPRTPKCSLEFIVLHLQKAPNVLKHVPFRSASRIQNSGDCLTPTGTRRARFLHPSAWVIKICDGM